MLKYKGTPGTRRRAWWFAPARIGLLFPKRTAGRAALAAALVASTAVTGTQAASAASSTVRATAFAQGTQAQAVTLPTGERVTVSDAAGKGTYVVAAPEGGRNAYRFFQGSGADHYIIPSEAEPYVGSVLSPSLFDLAQLPHAGLIQVSLAFAAGVTPTAPPGVILTSTAGSTARGYLSASSGTALAAGLRAAIGADVAAGQPAGSGRLFGGLASMSLATSAGPVAARPEHVLHTLQVDAADISGAPNDVFAFLMNNGSYSSEHAILPIYHGVGRIEVPAGDYSIDTVVFDYDADGNPTASRLVVVNDFTVPDTLGATTTIHLDESSADSVVSAATPRPATQQTATEIWSRLDPTGVGDTDGFVNDGNVPMYVSPQPATARIGSMHFQVLFLENGPTTGPQYRYDTVFMTSTIPADQTHRVLPSQLATLHQNLYSDPAAGTDGVSFLVGARDPYANYRLIAYGDPNTLYSGPFTEYLGTAETTDWFQGISSATGDFIGSPHTYRARHTYEVDWQRGPLAPNIGQYTQTPFTDYRCYACASGSAATLNFNVLGDSVPDHVSDAGFGENINDAVYINGAQIFDQPDVHGADLTGLPAGTSTFREVYDTSFSGNNNVSQTTSTHTDLTFRYTPGTTRGNTLPNGYFCSDDLGKTVAAPCQVLPVLSLNYQLAADRHNTSAALEQTMGLTVGHLGYGGHGSHAPIISASVSVSFDGGQTWAPTLVTGSTGHYTVCWRNPVSAKATSSALKVTARDAIGGSISQTITAAYTVAAQLK